MLAQVRFHNLLTILTIIFVNSVSLLAVINGKKEVTHFVLIVSFPVMTSSGPRFTVLSKSLMGLSTSGTTTMNKVVSGVVTTPSGRPVMRVPPLNVTASQSSSSGNNGQQTISQQQPQSIRSIVTRQAQKEVVKAQSKEQPKSEFHLVIKLKCQ